jgi:hypothetical protein
MEDLPFDEENGWKSGCGEVEGRTGEGGVEWSGAGNRIGKK